VSISNTTIHCPRPNVSSLPLQLWGKEIRITLMVKHVDDDDDDDPLCFSAVVGNSIDVFG
jgi:hypothetical protein